MSSGAKWNYQTSGFQTPQFMSDLHRHTKPMLENWVQQQRYKIQNNIYLGYGYGPYLRYYLREAYIYYGLLYEKRTVNMDNVLNITWLYHA